MSKNSKFIVETGKCVPNANTWATPDHGYGYFPLRFGGEKWDKAFEGTPHCEQDICRALFTAVDVLRCFNWVNNCCCENDLPAPYDCDCRCTQCSNANPADKLREAQLLIADAILNGWKPWGSQEGYSSDPLVESMSKPGQGSIKFATAVPLSSIKRQKCNSTINSGAALKGRLHSLLKCYLVDDDCGIQVIS